MTNYSCLINFSASAQGHLYKNISGIFNRTNANGNNLFARKKHFSPLAFVMQMVTTFCQQKLSQTICIKESMVTVPLQK